MTAELEAAACGDLWQAYALSPGVQERNALAERYLYLARRTAYRFSGRGVEYDDLYQVASLALITAIERFDAQKGVPFVSFAAPTLAGAVRNYFRDKSRALKLPRSIAEQYARLRHTREALSARLGREPSVSEIAAAMGMTEDHALDIIEARRATSAVSLDAIIGDSQDDSGALHTPASAVGMDERGYAVVDDRDQLSRALERLSPDERRLFRLRIVARRSQRETAEDIGASQMQVSRLERRLLDRMRQELRD